MKSPTKSNMAVFSVLATAAVWGACENVSDPLDIEGRQLPAHVIIQDTLMHAGPASAVEVIFQLPISLGEDVSVEYRFGGDAEYGIDWMTNTPGAGEIGGTATIVFDPDRTAFDSDTLTIQIPAGAAEGTTRRLNVNLESAAAESGRQLNVGQGPLHKRAVIQITGN